MNEALRELIKTRMESVQESIFTSAIKANRNPKEIRLVVVTKAQSIEVTQAAIEAGAKFLGENYPQEAAEKILALSNYSQVQWHMIGHLQSRKAKIVAEHFDMIQSIDSLATAQNMDKALSLYGRRMPALLEINVGGEVSKSGWQVSTLYDLEKILPDVEEILSLQNLQICGLMTMPPWKENPEDARNYFKTLAVMRDLLQGRFPVSCWDELSMGTSSDYRIAVEEGATCVRVGQAIVGPRPARQQVN